MKLRPMSEAPRDGTPILLLYPSGSDAILVAYWRNGWYDVHGCPESVPEDECPGWYPTPRAMLERTLAKFIRAQCEFEQEGEIATKE
jgi:hypothetical protein